MMAKMKILMLRNAAKRYECALSEGESGEVESTLAEVLIADGIAVHAEVKAVPEKPSVKAPTAKPASAE